MKLAVLIIAASASWLLLALVFGSIVGRWLAHAQTLPLPPAERDPDDWFTRAA